MPGRIVEHSLAILFGLLAGMVVAGIGTFVWFLISLHSLQIQNLHTQQKLSASLCFSDLFAKVVSDSQQYGQHSHQVQIDERQFTLFYQGKVPVLCKKL